jgi:outer membrane PBP1 activator LpoA protein
MHVRRRDRFRLNPPTACARLLALLLVLLPPALSVAQPRPASEPARTSAAAGTEAAGAPAAPRHSLTPTVPMPFSTPAPAPAPESTPPAPQVNIPLALVLPLDSPLYGRAADAVRAGFAAAAAAAATRFNLVAHRDGDVVVAFAKARAEGARVIVGPLVRDDLRAIVAADGDLPWTIALNQLDDGSPLPPHVYTLALSVEGEAVQLARRAREDGARKLVVVTSGTPLQQRFATAFTDEWARRGGAPPVIFRFDATPDMLSLLRAQTAKAAPDAVLLALNARDAALAKPYLGQAPAYTTSEVNDHPPQESLRDLDDVRFVEVPWLADPALPAFAGIARPDYTDTIYDRLYALGIDAFRVAQAFADGAPARLEFDGATGHVALDGSQQLVREGTVLQFRDGEIVPVASAR